MYGRDANFNFDCVSGWVGRWMGEWVSASVSIRWGGGGVCFVNLDYVCSREHLDTNLAIMPLLM